MIIVLSFAFNRVVSTRDMSPRHIVMVQSVIWCHNASHDDHMNALAYAAKENARVFIFSDDEPCPLLMANQQHERELRG